MVDHFVEVARAFALTISQEKTELLHQNFLHAVNSPAQITTNSRLINTVEQFTFLGGVVSNNTTITNNVDHRLAKASTSFGRL